MPRTPRSSFKISWPPKANKRTYQTYHPGEDVQIFTVPSQMFQYVISHVALT